MTDASKYADLASFDRTVILVGMMGAGKTTIGRRLAPRLGLPFFDADSEIEAAAAMTVGDLFGKHGEASFRRGEAKIIKRLLDGPPHVLATGGGALIDTKTRERIKQQGIAIWLKADLETTVRRAIRRGVRPLLNTGDPLETVARLLKERTPFYSTAPIHVDSQPGPHGNTVDAILEALRDYVANNPANTKEHSS